MESYLRSTVILILGNAKGKIAAFPAQILGSPIQLAVVSRFGWRVREPAPPTQLHLLQAPSTPP